MAANEEQLLRQFQAAGSRDALRELLVVHQDRVYNACFQVLGRAEDAEDAAQEALLKLAEGARAAKDADAFRGWIYRVSFRIALDHWRRREATRNRELRSAMNRPSAPTLDDRERLALFEAMDGLDDRDRALLLEHYFEKVPLAALGERRGVSAVAIWKRIDRAREKLKKTLQGAGFIAASGRFSEALEASVPAAAPATLVGEAILGKILAGGLAVGATKAPLVAAVVIALVFLFAMATGGYVLLRPDLPGKPSIPDSTKSAKVTVLQLPAAAESRTAQSPELPAKKSPLLETLDRYRAWFEEGKKQLTRPPDPEDPFSYQKYQHRGFLEFREARKLIYEDPGTFLEFIRDPRNEDLVANLVENLLGKLDVHEKIGTSTNNQDFTDFPTVLMDGLFDSLDSGSQPLKTGILSFLNQVRDVPAKYDEAYETLMYNPDPRIQYLALRARWRQRQLDIPTLEKILARLQTATDPQVQQTALLVISYSPRPETFRWMLEAMESDKGGPLSPYLAFYATSMSSKLTLDDATTDRLIRNLVTVYERQDREFEQKSLISVALCMPVKDSRRVLEATLPKAVTPKLKTAIQSTLEKSADGSATWNDLQNHFWRLMK